MIEDQEVVSDIQKAFESPILSSRISELMDVKNFLNPMEETIHDGPLDIENQILAQYGPEITEKSDEEVEVAPRITTMEASESLQKMQLFLEQQPESDQAIIYQLSRLDWLIRSKKLADLQQRYTELFSGMKLAIWDVYIYFGAILYSPPYNEIRLITSRGLCFN